jgi:NAD(P)-dependent dehydrogenase (short-subunit alcohol dehydrogenase family)
MDLTDKVVLITGASSGIGAATARAAADAGARVVPPPGRPGQPQGRHESNDQESPAGCKGGPDALPYRRRLPWKAFRGAFQGRVRRLRPLPVESRLISAQPEL